MWLCCPSAFKPEVGPRVVSEAGEPASPRAAAAARSTAICAVLNPSFIQIGINNTAKIGIVPNDVPIPIVIKCHKINIIRATAKIFSGIIEITEFTRVSIEPDALRTEENPAATSITKATYPIRYMPSFIILSILFFGMTLSENITPSPTKAPKGSDFVSN